MMTQEECREQLIGAMNYIRPYIKKKLGSYYEYVEDVLNDAALDALKGCGSFEGRDGAKFKTWFARVAINRALMFLRTVKPNVLSLEDKLENDGRTYADVLPSNEIGQERLIRSMELRRKLEAGLELLTERRKVVLRLYFVEGYTAKEIGRMLGENPNTVKARVFQTKHMMREFLKGSEKNEELFRRRTCRVGRLGREEREGVVAS